MKASELRIGNLVYHIDKIIEIESLHPKDDDVNDEIPFHAIFGIPLTEEWLLRFGFRKGVKGWFKTYGRNKKFNLYMYMGLFNHVHQLQNLYFSLTNTEL